MVKRLALALLLVIAGPALAQTSGKTWWWQNPANSAGFNGSINIQKPGGTSVAGISNPSGVTKPNVSATTQAPTVVVQASAGLPFVAIGSACTSGTDTAAVSSSDKKTLLTCGATNTWQITSRVSLLVVTEGAACNATTDGNLAVDASGLALSCQSGRWRGAVNKIGDTMTGRLTVQTDDWAVVARTAAGADNAAPQSGIGSLYANDVYLRSIGKYASQLGGGGFGGMYSLPAAADYWVCGSGSAFDWRYVVNPKTGGYSCPSGYNDAVIGKATYCRQDVGAVGWELHMCYN